MSEMERRAFDLKEFTVTRAEEKPKLVGHAAVFNREADIAGLFFEVIEPGAFREAIQKDDVRALFNHDANLVLGRNRAGTLKLAEDDIGLRTEIVPPDTQWARDLLTSIERGDVNQMSFGFRVLDGVWEKKDGKDIRRIRKVQLYDVSPVTFPAYPQTEVGLRSLEQWNKEHDTEQRQMEDTAIALAQSARDRDLLLLQKRS